jgi:homoserine dehydrogenase
MRVRLGWRSRPLLVTASQPGAHPSQLSQLPSRPALIPRRLAPTPAGARAQAAIAHGQRVVCANKKPFSAQQAVYDALVGAPCRHMHRVRHESTVGAGLPVIAALNRLLGA